MARYKLSATVVLLQVCRLSAEANGPTDLLHRANNIDDQHMTARDGGVGAHHRTGATASVTATRMYRGNNNFVDPSEYSDREAVSLTPAGGHSAPNAAGDGDKNRMRARRMKRIRARTRAAAKEKRKNKAGRKRPPSTLPRGTINSTPDIDMDPAPDQDTESDHFRTDHIFDPHYNGDDVIEVENEMRDGGATFEYDERNFDVDFGCFPFDLSYPVSFSPDSRSGGSGKKSKSGAAGGGAAAGSSSKSSKSSRASEVGKDDDDNDVESPKSDDNDGESPKSSKSSKPSEVSGDDDDKDGESPKSSKSSKDNRSKRQRYRALWKNGRNLRGDGEVDEDRMAALREEEDPSLQGVVAVIAAHQQREDRQRQKKLQRRRNRTPEEKARDRALATSARRR